MGDNNQDKRKVQNTDTLIAAIIALMLVLGGEFAFGHPRGFVALAVEFLIFLVLYYALNRIVPKIRERLTK